MDPTTFRRHRACEIRALVADLAEAVTDAARLYDQGWGLRRVASRFGIGRRHTTSRRRLATRIRG